MKITPNSSGEADLAAEPMGGYEVGYGEPPRRAGFQKSRSGNPKGRPRGSKNLATLLSQALHPSSLYSMSCRRRKPSRIDGREGLPLTSKFLSQAAHLGAYRAD